MIQTTVLISRSYRITIAITIVDIDIFYNSILVPFFVSAFI